MSTTTTARSAAARRRNPSTRRSKPGTSPSTLLRKSTVLRIGMRSMMQLSQVARAVSGRPSRPLAAETVSGVSTDTRSLRAGDLFFALRGASFDAHDYLAQAFEKGAAAAVVDREVPSPGLTISVGNTLEALGTLAAAYRMTLEARVVGV